VLGRRNYRVYVQADEQFRSKPEDIGQLYVRSARDEMIPLSNLVTLTPQTGAQTINHYNLFRSIEITGSPAPGYSSGDAIAHMEQVAAQVLPPGLSYEWSGTSLEEIQSGGQAPLIFGLGLVLVFLVLAAQYENYIDPLIIMLAVPLAILGALSAQLLRGLENDVYCQVGLVMLIGLASKNSILIVEFANQLRETGLSITKAAVEASQQRLRPILMTAISTLVGIFPLAIATGAGAGSRQSLGTAVFGGMLVATFLSLFIVPVLYIVVTSLRVRVQKRIRSSVTSD
jgi:hydrophobic/amphiphilic exporter-1 (mainly G- bacteria), HAE1 family